jgi:hypothetical protein
MRRSLFTLAVFLVLLSVMSAATATSAESKKNGTKGNVPPAPAKVTGDPVATYININNISTVLRNNGTADINVQQTNSGFVYPKGSAKTAIYESGFIWGARVGSDPQPRVGGSTYSSGLQPGKITSPGVAEDPNAAKNRIYRVRPDYKTADLSSEIADEGKSASEIRGQYETDWNQWPAADGAPFKDVDSNGVYDPTVDIPGVPGADQTVWFVANDLNPTNVANLYGAQPLGIECQFTIWGYSQQGALGNMIFKSYKMINKSNSTFDSMYVAQWADPDLGNATDDFAGCDTSLSLGYIYNSSNVDATYNELPPPAAGFDFFQGPVVSSAATDTAITQGRRIGGKKNLPMTAFFYFINSDPYLTDPTLKDPAGSVQMYNFMRGRIGLTGQLFQDPAQNPTTYALAGDPQTGKGWIDGQLFPAGDRRLGLSSGPFTMAPGDTQEIVVAEIAAGAIPGVDRLAAIGLLKFFDKVAQQSYDNNFQLPSPPPAPNVQVSELSSKVVLNWGTNPAQVTATEKSNVRGFKFQGYNVYQLPSASATIEKAKRVATYDVIETGTVEITPDSSAPVQPITRITDLVFDPQTGAITPKIVQFGTDSGLKHFVAITGDAFNGGNPLINGIRYYFAVTAYSYSPDPNAVPNNLENPLSIITAVPHGPAPGQRYQGAGGDTVKTVEHAGPSDGTVLPIIVDPSKTTGHQYRVLFASARDTTKPDSVVWKLVDVTRGDTLLNLQGNQTGDESYLVVDGIQVKVQGPPPGMKDYDIPHGTRRWTWAGGADVFKMEGFNGAIGNGLVNWGEGFAGAPYGVSLSQLKNVLIKFAATDTAGNVLNPADSSFSFGYRYLRHAADPAAKPEFAPFIMNPTAGYAFQDYKKSVPFAAFDVESNPPRRLEIGFLENNVEGGDVNGRYWPPLNTAADNGASDGPREWFWIFDKTYSETADPALQVDILDNYTPVMWFGTPARRADVAWADSDQFLIMANHINTPADIFTWTAPNVTNDPAVAKADINMINAFPNPYYGVNTEELNKYQRFITFSHLPIEADIRIFNLGGVMVRHIHKTSNSTFERWDLNNESGLPVGSGLYIVHITMPGLGGATKILKVAIVQEQQILDRF